MADFFARNTKIILRKLLKAAYGGAFQPHALAEEVESLKNSIFIGRLVEADFTYIFQQGEVDDAGRIFFVMQHQLVQVVVVFAGEGEWTVVSLMNCMT